LNQRGTDVENSRETFHQKPSERDEKRLFLSGDADPKVPTDDTSEEDLSGGDNEPADISEHEPTPIIQQTSQDDLHEHDFHLDGKIDTKETWQHMKNLPIWLKEYLTWHQEQRALITPDNWKNFTYIILQCVREDPHCGGTSDRLKPIPFLLYVAYKFRRIFLIWWTRPCALEEFLVPNAINWTVPEFIPLSDPEQNGRIIAKLENVLNWAGKPERIIRPRIQTYDGGQLLYENRTGSSYNDVYHDLFRLLFEPAPPIAKILRTEMKQAGLVPGEYAVAHYRAFYARASRRPEMIAKHAINAANCASQLRPGGPIYFASDSLHALAKVREYAKEHSYKIVTIENQEPLHLDKAGNWSVRHPSDFYSIFVDLFLMGMGRCLTFGQGGFGRFGLLLSYNATCTSRHIYKTHQMDCEWAEAIQPKAPES
jgi:hypothetical protein